MSASLQANGGGIVRLARNATYLVGEQYTGGTPYLTGREIISVTNARRLIVEMNGATLKFKDGMKFGAFDPATGDPIESSSLATNRANMGVLIRAENVDYVRIRNGELDCNVQGAVIGGLFGPTGRQCTAYGIELESCHEVVIEHMDVHDSPLDGIMYRWAGLEFGATAHPFTLRDTTIERCARNNLAVTGGNSVLVDGVTSSDAGNAVNDTIGRFGSAPQSCFDIEASGAVIENMTVSGSSFLEGEFTSTCLVAGSGQTDGVTIDDCDLAGNLWLNKPGIAVTNSRINGEFGKLYGDGTADSVRIEGCTISDVALGNGVQLVGQDIIAGLGILDVGVVFDTCTITVTRNELDLRRVTLIDTDIVWQTGVSDLANQGTAINAGAMTVYERVTITEDIDAGDLPADAFVAAIPGAAEACNLVSAGSKLKWGDWDGDGFTGALDNTP